MTSNSRGRLPERDTRELVRADPLALAETLADEIAALLVEAVAERGRATLAVSGGSTPKPLFVALSCRPAPWERVFVTLADERWVPTSDPASNEGMVRRDLLQGLASRARMVGLRTTAPSAEEALTDLEARLTLLPRPIDVLVLGMGEDGHTASLFPGARGLADALDPRGLEACAAIHPPHAPHTRVTLTLPTLAEARRAFLHVTGAAKLAVLETALAPGANPLRYPVGAVAKALGDRLTIARSP